MVTEGVVFCCRFSGEGGPMERWILRSGGVAGACGESDSACVQGRDRKGGGD